MQPNQLFNQTCSKCAIHNLCFTVGLSAIELSQIDSVISSQKILHKNDSLFTQGEAFNCIYAIRSGSFKTYQLDNEGREQIQGFFMLGELLGFGAIADKHYHYSAIALETSSVCVIEFEELFSLAVKVPNLQRQILNIMSQRISPEQHITLNSSAEQRLATFLLSVSARLQRRSLSAQQFYLSMSRQDIANYLGLASETVSRLFAQLQQDNVLAIDKRKVTILDRDALQALSLCLV